MCRHHFKTRRIARRGHAIRSDLDAEPKLPRADRRDKADRACAENRQRRAGSATERSLLARQRHVTGGSSGAKSAPAGGSNSTRKPWLATASAKASMPPGMTMLVRAALISVAPRNRPFR